MIAPSDNGGRGSVDSFDRATLLQQIMGNFPMVSPSDASYAEVATRVLELQELDRDLLLPFRNCPWDEIPTARLVALQQIRWSRSIDFNLNHGGDDGDE